MLFRKQPALRQINDDLVRAERLICAYYQDRALDEDTPPIQVRVGGLDCAVVGPYFEDEEEFFIIEMHLGVDCRQSYVEIDDSTYGFFQGIRVYTGRVRL